MEVLSITQLRARETVAMLKHLMKRAERGEIEGLAICIKPYGDDEQTVFTDLYTQNSALAVGAALRLSVRLNELQQAARRPR